MRIDWFDESAEPAAANGSKSTTAVALGQQRQQRAELMQIPLNQKLAADIAQRRPRSFAPDEGFGAPPQKPAADSGE